LRWSHCQKIIAGNLWS